VLGFVGAPFTLATYIVEGGSSKNFAAIKRMAFAEPAVLHALLDKLADNVADYVRYQVRAKSSSLGVEGRLQQLTANVAMRCPGGHWKCRTPRSFTLL
jgi:uroporphyrinogen-III decarboxylase